MKRLHIALSTHCLAETVDDYSQRLASQPSVVVEGQYALWRTESLNFSVRVDHSIPAGELRHLGWEDDEAEAFTSDTDVNGLVWERFAFAQQEQEIEKAFFK